MFEPQTNVLLAGAFAAFTVDILVFPLDTLKTRFQSPEFKKIYYDESTKAANIRSLYRGLYQGIGSVVLITVPASGSFFTAYEGVKSLLKEVNDSWVSSNLYRMPQPLIHSAASAVAELVSCFILTPAEVLKQNAQMIRKPSEKVGHKSSTILSPSISMQALRQFRRPGQLWRGYFALAARNLPFTAIQFPLFELAKDGIKSYRESRDICTGTLYETAWTTAVSASSAGSFAALITTPFDVVKTRIMLSASEDVPSATANYGEKRIEHQQTSCDSRKASTIKTKTNWAIARDIMTESGVRGFFRGGTLRATWTAVGSGLYLGTYESAKNYLGDHGNQQE